MQVGGHCRDQGHPVLADSHTHTNRIDRCREGIHNSAVAGQHQSLFGHSAVKLQCGHVAGGGMTQWCCVMKGMMNSEWEVITPSYLSYLLVLGVLWSEVAAHQLKFHVEMRQPVEQVHPPRWRVVHYSRHPDANTCRLSLHSRTQFLTQKLWSNPQQSRVNAQHKPPVMALAKVERSYYQSWFLQIILS